MARARYKGLVWDFAEKITATPPSHELAREYVADLLLISRLGLHKSSVEMKRKLGRALSVALSLNADELVRECADALLDFEQRVAVDRKAGLWGFSFDLLLSNKKVPLSKSEEERIISELEARLVRLSSGSDDAPPDPWTSEHAASRLATYYHARNKREDVRRVLGYLQLACEDVVAKASPLMGYKLIENLHSMYERFDLHDEAATISTRIREMGQWINNDLREISHSVDIPAEEFEAYIQGMIAGGMENAIQRIAARYIPRQDEVETRVRELFQSYPLQFLGSRHITDYRGRVVAVIGSLEDDMEGHVARQMAQDMSFSSTFLDPVIALLIDTYGLTPDVLCDLISRSPIFVADKRTILSIGLTSYVEEDYITSVHLLIPQIEDAIRELAEALGRAVLKRVRNGGFHLKTLDELLRDKGVREVLGDGFAAYLRVLLTDQRGWNLRNDICHRVMPSEAFGKGVADRIIHALFCLSLLRKQDDSYA